MYKFIKIYLSVILIAVIISFIYYRYIIYNFYFAKPIIGCGIGYEPILSIFSPLFVYNRVMEAFYLPYSILIWIAILLSLLLIFAIPFMLLKLKNSKSYLITLFLATLPILFGLINWTLVLLMTINNLINIPLSQKDAALCGGVCASFSSITATLYPTLFLLLIATLFKFFIKRKGS